MPDASILTPAPPAAPAPLRPVPRLALAVLPVLAASLTGALLTAPNIPTWYAGLAKPGFTPPNWAFPLAWSLLYAAMAYAAWRVLGLRPGRRRRLALAAFFVQLALNAAWTPVFFVRHDLLGGLVVVAALLVMVLWTARLFGFLDRVAGWLLAPYAAWVAYATLLNAAIWRMNG
jgi:translocator protein